MKTIELSTSMKKTGVNKKVKPYQKGIEQG